MEKLASYIKILKSVEIDILSNISRDIIEMSCWLRSITRRQ